MMRKVMSVSLAVILILTLFSGFVLAQSGTYVDPPATPPAPPAPPVLPPAPVPADWVGIPMLDLGELVLRVGGRSAILNATVPIGFGSPTLTWRSLNPNIATVVANSPARVTPVSVGNTHIVVSFTHEGTTYYDSCYVRVLHSDAVATPRTGGSHGVLYIFAALLLVVALPPLFRPSFER